MGDEYQRRARKNIERLRAEFFVNANAFGDDLQPTTSHRQTLALAADRLARSIGDPVPDWARRAIEANRHESRNVIADHHAHFMNNGNPLYVCFAYLEARSIGDPLPEWIVEWLDRGVSRFWRSLQAYAHGQFDDPVPNRPDEAFSEAFGLRDRKPGRETRRGRRSIFNEFTDTRWMEIGLNALLLGGGGKLEKTIVYDAMQMHNKAHPDNPIKVSAAWGDWSRFKRVYPQHVTGLLRNPIQKREERPIQKNGPSE